jgi:inorganic phosphate transporter, PiT family
MSHEIFAVILACLFGLFLTWGVGANDLANILSPTLGSKAITAKQAIIIALIFELAGALFGGGKVAATVQHGIINTESLINSPALLIDGMLAALLASSLWITIASRIGVPVSLTNSIVGSVVGFGSLVLGWQAVHWGKIGFIGMSWILCPISAGCIAYLLFFSVQRLILSSDEPLAKARRYLPFFLFIVGFVLAELTVIKGLRHFAIETTLAQNITISTIIACIVLLVGQLFLKRIYARPYLDLKEQFALVEKAFALVMLFTICAMVYAHGSDDIATSTGPVAAVVSIFMAGTPTHNGNVVTLILVGGYLGVIIGFLTYGRRVAETVGSKITTLTPSRAFCATLAASCTVVTSTTIGIPVSATQTLVGAILGVGLAHGIGAIDLRIVRNIFTSWFITIPITALLTTVLFYIFKIFFH